MTELTDYLYWMYQSQAVDPYSFLSSKSEDSLLLHEMEGELESFLMRERYIIQHPRVKAFRELLHKLSKPYREA